MKKLLILFTLISFLSCNDDDSDSVYYELNDFEVSVLSNEEAQSVQFQNQIGETFGAEVTATTREQANASSDGIDYTLDSMLKDLNFTNDENNFRIIIFKNTSDLIEFKVLRLNDVGQIGGIHEVFQIEGCSPGVENLESHLESSVTVQGFTYENAFVLTQCESNEPSSITQIIYSLSDGLVFIEYEDGSYYRRS